MAGQGIIEMTRESFDEMPDPTDEYLGQIVYVREDTDQSSFLAYGRVDVAGDNKWIVVADQIQIPIESARTFTNLDAVGASFGGATSLVDLADFAEVRFGLRVTVAGNTGKAILTYNNGDGETDMTSNHVELGSTGYKMSDWEAVPAAARVPCAIKVKGYDGDNSEDPQIINCIAHFRR